jgi:hypothetical protein
MPNPPVAPFQVLVKERKDKQRGIDFPRAYRALIRGFLRAKTVHTINTSQTHPD